MVRQPAIEGDANGKAEMTGRRVLGIGLDPYTIDFDSDFFKRKSLNAEMIAGGIKAEEATDTAATIVSSLRV